MTEAPTYGKLVYVNADETRSVEVLTCLEPECERGPCKQPDEHERWFQLRQVEGGWFRPNDWAESNALRHKGYAMLCRNCRHWAGRLTVSAHEGDCRLTHPLNDHGKAVWPRMRHDDCCGDWVPSARLRRVALRKAAAT